MTNVEILNLRKSLNLSMNDFGKLFGVTAPAVIKWEQGYSRPTNMIESSMITLRDKIENAKLVGRENEAMESLKVILITGGVLAFLIWLFSED